MIIYLSVNNTLQNVEIEKVLGCDKGISTSHGKFGMLFSFLNQKKFPNRIHTLHCTPKCILSL